MDNLIAETRTDRGLLRARVAELERALAASKERERALQESETRLRLIIEGSDDGGWDWDIPTGQAYMSPSWFRMLGFEPGELPSDADTWSRLMHPEDAPRVWEALQRFLDGITPTYEVEYRMVHKSGKPVWVMARAKVFSRDAAGRPVRMTGTLRDLTERRLREEERAALQESLIAAQRAAIRELSTPLLPIADGVVVLPLIGTVDSQRAQQFMETMLDGVSAQRARTVILDVTGVEVIDTAVANALVKASQAVGLLGAKVVITGIRPEVAMTLVSLGASLGGIVTRATLRSGVAYALGQCGQGKPPG